MHTEGRPSRRPSVGFISCPLMATGGAATLKDEIDQEDRIADIDGAIAIGVAVVLGLWLRPALEDIINHENDIADVQIGIPVGVADSGDCNQGRICPIAFEVHFILGFYPNIIGSGVGPDMSNRTIYSAGVGADPVAD